MLIGLCGAQADLRLCRSHMAKKVVSWRGSCGMRSISRMFATLYWTQDVSKTFRILLSVSIWTASSEFSTYRLCEQRRFRRACASAQSRQNLRYSLMQEVSQEEPSDRKPDLWPLLMAGHAQLKFITTECSKTQIRLTGSIFVSLTIYIHWSSKTPRPVKITIIFQGPLKPRDQQRLG